MNQYVEIAHGIFQLLTSFLYSIILLVVPKKYFFKDVKDQVVLITGGGSGFGRILAYKFAVEHGSIAVIWDVNQAGLDQTMREVKQAGGKCYSYLVDVSSKDAIYKAAKQVKTDVGPVTILINNAGIGNGSFLEETQDEYVEKVFKINTLAHYWTVKAFVPEMVKVGHGHIVTLSSVAGLFGTPRLTHYCGSKFAAAGFHEAIGAELSVAYPDVKFNTTLICPYFTRTPLIAGKEDEIKSTLLFPIREPEPVVAEMMEGILTNEDLVITSVGIRVLYFLKAILPSRTMKVLRKLFATLKATSRKNE